MTFESNVTSGERERPLEVRHEEQACGNWKTGKGRQELGASGGALEGRG